MSNLKNILIIEDEATIANLERDYLEANGFSVDISGTEDDGLYQAMTGNYDLIILDLMLPAIDGFEICKKIRNTKNIPIIMVSAKKKMLIKSVDLESELMIMSLNRLARVNWWQE
ncbi:DNA-binding response OmpR family regulator [Bacillus capparidis]|uniref:DNA-binding response OmpR family regulator n=1 Tax=Bacillus capparidis TaxID=1840411 RepID=A0ABS4D2Z5_9BACI|nr:DNA-binding response OmpR family regulator [Bacillus capparidis]